MIEVILLERIERLGHMGQTVKVRPGFARNFLLPQNKALRATKANLELFEKQRAELEARNASERAVAEAFGKTLDNVKLVVIRQASDSGQLYGSVSARDVADAAKEAKYNIQRSQVLVDEPIKSLGIFPVKVKLHAEVTIKVMINVARNPEEAVVQAEKGSAAIKIAEEKAELLKAFGVPEEEIAATIAADKAEKPAKKTKAKAESAEEAPAKAAKKPRSKKSA